jgi:hypothetical protein
MRYAVALLAFAAFPPAARADQKTFDSNGGKIAYLDEGKGEVVVLLHGFSASAEEMWTKLPLVPTQVLPVLAKEYRVVAPDFRGHGGSDKPHEPKKYGKEMAGDLWEGKRTLMLIHLFRQATPAERDRLTLLLRLPRELKREVDVRWMLRRMDAYGSIDYARHIAHGLAGAARHEFSLLYGGLPDSRDKRFIEGIVTWVFDRDA